MKGRLRDIACWLGGELLHIDEPSAKERKNKVSELKWKRASKLLKKNYTLEANILLGIPENVSPLPIFEWTANLYELEKHICDEKTLYAT